MYRPVAPVRVLLGVGSGPARFDVVVSCGLWRRVGIGKPAGVQYHPVRLPGQTCVDPLMRDSRCGVPDDFYLISCAWYYGDYI